MSLTDPEPINQASKQSVSQAVYKPRNRSINQINNKSITLVIKIVVRRLNIIAIS